MNTRHTPPPPREPLTPEEREWADRLALIGPHDGPPPALDTKILAAAHAAVARQPRQRPRYRRWPTLVGAAASLVIVVGMAWQLQPLLRSRPSLSEGAVAPAPLPSSSSSLPEDVLAAADTVAQSAAAKPPSAPATGVVAPPAAPVRSRPPVGADAPRRPPSRRAPPSSGFGDDAIPPYTDYAGVAASRQAASQAAANEARASSSERGNRAAAAAAVQPQAFPTEPTAEVAAAPPPPAASPAPAASGAMAAARDASERKALAMPSPAAVMEQDNAPLNRVEVTGSRITLADLPVQDDTRLEPAAWLQRIRDRRDASDLTGARQSLVLFRQTHPHVRLPADIARIAR